ncbi:MAG: chemotaxis-specific protein-glutamate methyltransferase CheB [Nitrospinae bacterium]|nr:chemotaxis-specific protein-glutamate methyltransferase CheB [Nitrospinota bacterium]
MGDETYGGKPPKIKVLLVDDSPTALALLGKMLAETPDIVVVGEAKNGVEALELIPRIDPHVVCTDLHMPVMDGLDMTKEIMDKYPRPILVVSVSVREGSKNIFHLMEAGALDVFPKPRGGEKAEFLRQSNELANRIRILAGVHVFRVCRNGAVKPVWAPPSAVAIPRVETPLIKVVVIGASTGGPQALQRVLCGLPLNFPAPVICIQHIGEGFLKGLAEWLESVCVHKIEIAREGTLPEAGKVYFPPEEAHLLFDNGGRFKYSRDIPYNGHRPSITATFTSAAERYGSNALGVLLTGMGSDGADGLKAIFDANGITIAQDERTSVVFGMPKRAAELGAARNILPLDEIAPMIISYISFNVRAGQ